MQNKAVQNLFNWAVAGAVILGSFSFAQRIPGETHPKGTTTTNHSDIAGGNGQYFLSWGGEMIEFESHSAAANAALLLQILPHLHKLGYAADDAIAIGGMIPTAIQTGKFEDVNQALANLFDWEEPERRREAVHAAFEKGDAPALVSALFGGEIDSNNKAHEGNNAETDKRFERAQQAFKELDNTVCEVVTNAPELPKIVKDDGTELYPCRAAKDGAIIYVEKKRIEDAVANEKIDLEQWVNKIRLTEIPKIIHVPFFNEDGDYAGGDNIQAYE